MKPILILLLLCFSFPAFSQKKTDKIVRSRKDSTDAAMHIIANNYGDSIVVRWAPGNAILWMLSQKNGFVFRRMVFTKSGKNVFKRIDSSSVVVHLWQLNEWAAYFKSSHDTLSTLAAQILYGKTVPFNNSKEGNSFNTIFDKYNEQQNHYGYAMMLADFSPAIANGLGLRFVDRNVKKDLYYLYSVYPAGNQLQGLPRDTGRILINGSEKYVRQKFSGITAVPGDSFIKLFWNTSPANSYSGYIVERSENGQQFRRLTQMPYVAFQHATNLKQVVEYSDSISQNYKKYYYRVSGINAFGDVSDPSPTIITAGLDLTSPQPPLITSIKNIPGTQKISIQWSKKNKEPDFKGYVVGRSTNLEGPYTPINKDLLPFATTGFIDESPAGLAPNYYIVAVVDTAGNAGRSMPAYTSVDDHTPPAQPQGLTGGIDSSGRVNIHWNWGKEADLAGYKIFFANAPDHQFTPLNKELSTDSLFTDSITLKTLTKKIYYKVIAYDRAMNASLASSILELNKPDKIPPVSAVIHGFMVTDSSVIIKWYRSASADAARQLLYRKKDSADTWELLSTLPATDTAFTDRGITPQHHYSYSIETLDSSQLSAGKSFPLQVYTYDKGYKGNINNFEVTKAQDKNKVLLKWNPPGQDISYYVLFKGLNNTGLKMAGNITGNSKSYEDTPSTGNYQYAIKAVYLNGKESALSEIKTIQVK